MPGTPAPLPVRARAPPRRSPKRRKPPSCAQCMFAPGDSLVTVVTPNHEPILRTCVDLLVVITCVVPSVWRIRLGP
jgi:hypothetical protein